MATRKKIIFVDVLLAATKRFLMPNDEGVLTDDHFIYTSALIFFLFFKNVGIFFSQFIRMKI
jgi:hypothetical protein